MAASGIPGNGPIPPTVSGIGVLNPASLSTATSGGASDESPILDAGCPCAAVTSSPDRTLLAVGGKEGIPSSCLSSLLPTTTTTHSFIASVG
jgi:hypothetical protein